MAEAELFNDTFNITAINNQKYDRVSRLSATSANHDVALTLDINHELFPTQIGDSVTLMLARTLNLDGSTSDERGWKDKKPGETDLGDMYEYVCHGKVYRFEEGEGDNIKVYVSFGGLLLYVEGPYRRLTPLRLDYVYLLMKH